MYIYVKHKDMVILVEEDCYQKWGILHARVGSLVTLCSVVCSFDAAVFFYYLSNLS